jgi:hypothetical protein
MSACDLFNIAFSVLTLYCVRWYDELEKTRKEMIMA